MTRQAATFGNRLLAGEPRTMGLRAELAAAPAALDTALRGSGGAPGAMEAPSDRYPWPLAKRQGDETAPTSQYERQVDAPIVNDALRAVGKRKF